MQIKPLFLIVDDSESGLVIKKKLIHMGAVVLRAKTNQQAIRFVDEHLDSLSGIIVDIHLRHTSAFEFLYEMRSYHDMQEVPLTVYSSLQIPSNVLSSLDWKLLNVDAVFYKSKHSVTDVCESLMRQEISEG